jgi:hypothetical protein
MSLKDQMPFFSNPPAWYYRAAAIACGIIAVLWLYPIGLCLWGHEYWPLLIFGVIMLCLVFSARGFWQRARMKENERFDEDTTPDAS